MSNYSLKGIAESIDNLTINPQSSSSTSVTTLVAMNDAQGNSQSLYDLYVGICFVRFGDEGIDSDDGPNDRAVIANSTNVLTADNSIQVTNHGFDIGDVVRFTTSSGSNSTGTLPSGLSTDTDYYVVYNANPNFIRVSTTSGGSAVNITDVGSGTFYVTRNAFIALDAQDWLSTGSSAINVLAVNFKFRYGVQAYKWLSRYTTVRKMAFLVGLPEDRAGSTANGARYAEWNSLSSSSTSYDPRPSIMGGREWENFDDVYFYGLLLPQEDALTNYLGKRTGAISFSFGGNSYPAEGTGFSSDTSSYGLGTTGTVNGHSRDANLWRNAAYAAFERCRIVAYVTTNVGHLFWFRYTNKLYMQNIHWVIGTYSGGELSAAFQIGAKVTTFNNLRLAVWTAASTGNSWRGFMHGNSAPIEIGEGAGTVYIMGSVFQISTGSDLTDPDMLKCGGKGTLTIDPNNQFMYVNYYSGIGYPYKERAKIVQGMYCTNASHIARGFRLSQENWTLANGTALDVGLQAGTVTWFYKDMNGNSRVYGSQPGTYYYWNGSAWVGMSSHRFYIS